MQHHLPGSAPAPSAASEERDLANCLFSQLSQVLGLNNNILNQVPQQPNPMEWYQNSPQQPPMYNQYPPMQQFPPQFNPYFPPQQFAPQFPQMMNCQGQFQQPVFNERPMNGQRQHQGHNRQQGHHQRHQKRPMPKHPGPMPPPPHPLYGQFPQMGAVQNPMPMVGPFGTPMPVPVYHPLPASMRDQLPEAVAKLTPEEARLRHPACYYGFEHHRVTSQEEYKDNSNTNKRELIANLIYPYILNDGNSVEAAQRIVGMIIDLDIADMDKALYTYDGLINKVREGQNILRSEGLTTPVRSKIY